MSESLKSWCKIVVNERFLLRLLLDTNFRKIIIILPCDTTVAFTLRNSIINNRLLLYSRIYDFIEREKSYPWVSKFFKTPKLIFLQEEEVWVTTTP